MFFFFNYLQKKKEDPVKRDGISSKKFRSKATFRSLRAALPGSTEKNKIKNTKKIILKNEQVLRQKKLYEFGVNFDGVNCMRNFFFFYESIYHENNNNFFFFFSG